MIRNDASNRCWDTDRSELGEISLVLVKTKEVSIYQIRSYALIKFSVAQTFKKQPDSFVCIGVLTLEQPNRNIKRIHEQPIGLSFILTSD